jgi:hypothetical protein
MLRPIVAPLLGRNGLMLIVPISRELFGRCETGKLLTLQLDLVDLPVLLFSLGWLPDSDWSRFPWQGKSEDLQALQDLSQRRGGQEGPEAPAVLYRLSFQQRRTLFTDGMVSFKPCDLQACGPLGDWRKLVVGYIALAEDEQEYNRLKSQVLV